MDEEDAEIPQQSNPIEDPEANPPLSGDVDSTLDAAASSSSPTELDSSLTNDDDDGGGGCARVSESERSENADLVTRNEEEEEDDVSETEDAIEKSSDDDDQSSELGSGADDVAFVEAKRGGGALEKKPSVTDYKSLLSEFDDYVASEKMGSGVSRALSYGFQVGDLVWGKVKSHPWWPGHIFNEAFASPSVRRMRRVDHVLVAFFGDSSYGWFDPAELIPFEPHLSDKAHQTAAKHFVRAVEEAVDEASRRSALGLTCKCRNPYNFRATNVHDYFTVDVPDYEVQGVYSGEQIMKARDEFSPVEALSFVKELALAPQERDDVEESLAFLKKKAVVCAFRKAVFEEFDETYSQAFGTKSMRTSVTLNEPHNRTPSRAPLSGPLVIAETLGVPKSSKTPTKVKDSKKQDKYLLKRRDEAGDKTVPFGQAEASSSTGDSVLRRRASTLQSPMKDEQPGIVSMDVNSSSAAIPGKESSVPKLSLDEEKDAAEESAERKEERSVVNPEHEPHKQETGPDSGSAGSSLQPMSESPRGSHTSASEGKSSTGSLIKKLKVAKRSSSEMGTSENPPSEPVKKKKKMKEPNPNLPKKRKHPLSSGEPGAKKLSQLGSAHLHTYMEADVPKLLGHLQDLSLDPFSGSTVVSFGAARKFFLRFRSLNYQKSLSVSSSDANARDTNLSKPGKSVNRIEDPSKAGKKRLSSDRQDEIPLVKKLKKTNQLKPMASEKKIKLEAKDSVKPVREQSGAVQARPSKLQTGKKPASSAKVVEPTMLVMKFPPGTSLPSPALLKARFGRFGLLDQSAIRVFWKSSTCRVVFLYKADAQTAFRYATGNNSLFGNVNVRYFLRDVDAPKAEPQEPENTKEDDEQPQSQMPDQASPRHQPKLPPPLKSNLKSCLKKLGDDTSSNRPRVKFMLDGEENSSKATNEPPNRNDGPSSSSSSSFGMEFVSKKFQNVQLPPSTLPPILPLPPQYSKPIKTVDHVEPPMPPPPPPSKNFPGPSAAVGAGDISHQMLNLLSKCNDVVANVTGLLGYVPYHPL
ncbi:PREDICTED: uncharacterized protein LOC106317917 [Brassica oleracea var. oleracea]|uniref:PWWP domain-containing protein n=1 Tax=Brassica oleracea var. oleracea TaxID=109376 RepID=A0A0D3E140_BRAOL|nr:PREDICTED: uncharacterized protein LOC106317917 [Brassica oleracea var. oleracea]